jgi:hypothetical protein
MRKRIGFLITLCILINSIFLFADVSPSEQNGNIIIQQDVIPGPQDSEKAHRFTMVHAGYTYADGAGLEGYIASSINIIQFALDKEFNFFYMLGFQSPDPENPDKNAYTPISGKVTANCKANSNLIEFTFEDLDINKVATLLETKETLAEYQTTIKIAYTPNSKIKPLVVKWDIETGKPEKKTAHFPIKNGQYINICLTAKEVYINKLNDFYNIS